MNKISKKSFGIFFLVIYLVFFIIITPIGYLLRILGIDLLKLKFSKNNSYWLERKKNINSMNKQF